MRTLVKVVGGRVRREVCNPLCHPLTPLQLIQKTSADCTLIAQWSDTGLAVQPVFALPQGRAGTHRALHCTEQKKKVGSECQNTEVENAFLAGGTVDSHSLPRGRVHVLIFAPRGRKTIIVRHPHIARVFLNFSGDRDVMQKHVSHKASARSHYRTFLNSASRQWRRGNIPQLPSQAPNPQKERHHLA